MKNENLNNLTVAIRKAQTIAGNLCIDYVSYLHYILPIQKNLFKLSLGTDFFWAIHPGGKRIIEESQKSLSLNDSHVKDSWNVLENYGNMLSCSILFVLERILKRQNNYTINEEYEKHYKRGLAYSFSPGVGVESIMFKNIRPKG